MSSSEIVPFSTPRSLASIAANAPAVLLPNAKAAERFFDFFTANIRNRNTRRAYYKAACRFAEWAFAPVVAGILLENRTIDLAFGVERVMNGRT